MIIAAEPIVMRIKSSSVWMLLGVGPGSHQLGTAEMYRPKRFSSAASETKASQFLSSLVNKESKNVQLNLGKGEEVEGVKGEEETQSQRKIY